MLRNRASGREVKRPGDWWGGGTVRQRRRVKWPGPTRTHTHPPSARSHRRPHRGQVLQLQRPQAGELAEGRGHRSAQVVGHQSHKLKRRDRPQGAGDVALQVVLGARKKENQSAGRSKKTQKTQKHPNKKRWRSFLSNELKTRLVEVERDDARPQRVAVDEPRGVQVAVVDARLAEAHVAPNRLHCPRRPPGVPIQVALGEKQRKCVGHAALAAGGWKEGAREGAPGHCRPHPGGGT